MANVRKRILQLTPLPSASLDTTIVGVDNGVTYRIELDVLADAVTSRVNTLDRDRLNSLESVTSSFESNGRSIISSSAQITALGFTSSSVTIPTGTISSSAQITSFGFISESTDITSLNLYTSSQEVKNIAFTNGITARLQTSSFNEYTASQSTSSLVDRLNVIESVSGSWITESETGSFLISLSGAISSSSQLTSSYDTRYTLSGSVQPLPLNLVSSSAQITSFGFISESVNITSLNSFTSSQYANNTAFNNGISARLTTSSFNEYTASLNTSFPSKTIGSWSVPAGASTQSFTVDWNHSYQLWVIGNIPNGIISWIANVNVTNANVPIVGSQYGWYYVDGNALVLTSIPVQIVGVNGAISTTSFGTITSNTFEFGITNNSGTTQTINYGYIKIS
jgi:hypothetical protein